MAWCGMTRVPGSPERTYKALIVASVLGPALLLAGMGWWSWERTQRETALTITRTVDLLDEHATKLFEVNAVMLGRILDRVDGHSWPDIIAHEEELHRFLLRLTKEAPEIAAAFVADQDGELQALSRRYPAPARSEAMPTSANVRDRPYFAAARDRGGIVVFGPFTGRVSGEPIFNVARRLEGPDGSFRGVAVLVVSPKYVTRFWQGVVSPGDTVSLVREDGTVLARYPEVPVRPEAPARFSNRTMSRFRETGAGLISAPASVIDGIARTIGYRKLPQTGLYVAYAVDERNVLREWYRTFAAFAGLATLAAAALLLASFAVIRRARGEAAALAQAQAAAAALRVSEESQRALFRNAPIAMHALDVEGSILDVNDAWIRLLGYAREDVVGRRIATLQPEQQRGFDEVWAELLAGGSVRNVERRFLHRNGERVETVVSSMIERDASRGSVRAISVVEDVTARRRAEETARRERQFSELLVESSEEGIVALDRELRYTVWNPYMEAVSGIPRETLLGRHILEVLPHLADTPIEASWRAALSGRRSTLRDWRYRYPQSGREGYFDQAFAPLHGGDGEIVGAIAFIRDITERRRIEEELRQSQKMEAVGQLTGGIAHDFNNLLTSVIGNLEMLESELVSERGRKLLRAAARGAERGADLTKRLLAFSRRQQLAPSAIDLNRLLQGMRDMLARTLGGTVAVRIDLGSELWPAIGDATQIELAVLNLAVNARDAMPYGGTLTLATRNETVAAAGDAELGPGDYVVVAVSDTGTGMTEDVKARAFEPFYTTKEVGKGTGLGLSQVYGVARQLGGSVRLRSEPGEGTVVEVWLPRSREPVQVAEAAGAAAGAAGLAAASTVLVVDDDPDVRETTVAALRGHGFEVIEASSGAAGLRVVETGQPIDLLVVDFAMPGMDGIRFADEARVRRPDLRVLFVTGNAEASAFAPRAGDGVLLKPFRLADLAARVTELLAAPAAPPANIVRLAPRR
jgi:PAS domain S-box-containing protein